MLSVGVKELKNRLSQMLLSVKAGEELLITERGRPIARIIPEGTPSSAELQSLGEAARRGLLRLPADEAGDEPELVELRGGPLSETVLEGRR